MAFTKVSPAGLSTTASFTLGDVNATGVGTFASLVVNGNVNIAGTITYEDVTNIDSVGIATVRDTLDAQGNVTVGAGLSVVGVSTCRNTLDAQGNVIVGAGLSVVGLSTFQNGIQVTGGSVGIGSTQPTAKLDIFHSSNSESTAFFKNGGGSAPATVHIWEDNSSTLHYGLFVGKEDYTNPVLVTKQDKIGIGTDNPAAILTTVPTAGFSPANVSDLSGVGLFLRSANGIEGDGNYGSALAWSRPTDNGRFKTAIAPVQEGSDIDVQGLAFFTADNISALVSPEERVRISAAGHVGIGTDAPTHPVTISVNASGSQDALFITNKNTAADNTANIIFGPSNGVAGGRISCIAIEDFGTSAERTADFIFETRKDGTFAEALRIKNDGRILNTAGNAPYATSAKYRFYARYSNPAIAVEGTGQSYCEGAFVTIAPNNYRGGGLFMYNDNNGGTPIEWFAGRPYSAADQFIIARKSNPTGIGEDTAQTGNKLLLLSNGGNMTINGTLTQSGSDDKLKTNRVGITSALEKVKTLEGFTYNWNDDAINNYGFSADDGTLVGMSAQELQLVLPEAVKNISVDGEVEDPTSGEVGESREYLTIQYERVVPLLVQALKELSENNDALAERITALEG